jgi:hypothetical protein
MGFRWSQVQILSPRPINLKPDRMLHGRASSYDDRHVWLSAREVRWRMF